MTENIKNRMYELSEKIDQQIKNAKKQKPFSEHFEKWWKELNTECGKLYTAAGQEHPPSINLDDAVKWLNDQINKLHDFLSDYVRK